jgi:hypothetical protein
VLLSSRPIKMMLLPFADLEDVGVVQSLDSSYKKMLKGGVDVVNVFYPFCCCC